LESGGYAVQPKVQRTDQNNNMNYNKSGGVIVLKVLLSLFVAVTFFGCATTNPNSNYNKKIFASSRKAVVIGGSEAKIERKIADGGAVGTYDTIVGLFKSKEDVQRTADSREGEIITEFAKLDFVKKENRTNKEKGYVDVEVGGVKSNETEDDQLKTPSIVVVDPGEYYLKGYKYYAWTIRTNSYGVTAEYPELTHKNIKEVPLVLKEGDVVYIGNFECSDIKKKHSFKVLDLSKEIKTALSKKNPELTEKMETRLLKIEQQ
jgi:hypothetical protein